MNNILFDKAEFMASLANDEELARELLTAFMEDSPQRIAELRHAIETDDALNASKVAHSLKGMCGVVRAHALSDIALKMEHRAREGQIQEVSELFTAFTDTHAQVISQMQLFMA